jgi:choline dehydrogenase
LQVVTKALGRGIQFDGKPAVGVEFERDGPGAHIIERTEADREVILSAGPSARRTSCSSRVSAHPNIWAASGSRPPRLARGRAEPAGPLYRPHQPCGPGCSDGQPALARHRTCSQGAALSRHRQGYLDLQRLWLRPAPNVQCSIAPGSFKDGQIGAPGRPAPGRSGVDDFPGITAGAWQVRPLSRGYVEARSPNPGEAPAINPRFLSNPTDRRAMIGGLRVVRRLFAAPALARWGAEILPGGGDRER